MLLGKITVLDEKTANQIAAGEVIDRPSSVVKELIENSLDARAKNIRVEIKHGGKNLIRVIDDGTGIPRDQVALAFERHATSKLTSVEDLSRIRTLGFRGEALPSIAAVGQVEMRTRTEGEVAGTQVDISGGSRPVIKPVGCPVGTVVTVRNLFYNVPARQKHLRSETVEASHVALVVGQAALGNPGVSFSFVNNGRLTITTPGNDNLLDSILGVYGQEVADQVLPVEMEGRTVTRMYGYVSKPSLSRSTRKYQHFFINGRPVQSRLLAQVIDEAFETLLPAHRYPFCVLLLELEPAEVDVNVHPQKMEVRFANETAIWQELKGALRNSIRSKAVIPSEGSPKAAWKPLKNVKLSNKVAEQTALYWQAPVATVNMPFSGTTVETLPEKTKMKTGFSIDSNEEADFAHFPQLKVLGQLAAAYLITVDGDQLYLVDQHAAHERVMYERIMHKWKEANIPAQWLAVPETIEFSAAECQVVIANIVLFHNLGFTLEHFGGNTFVLRSVPHLLASSKPGDLIRDLVEKTTKEQEKDPALLAKDLIELLACKSAVKAGDKLNIEEMNHLLTELRAAENPFTCPHGRPTIIHISLQEINRRFYR